MLLSTVMGTGQHLRQVKASQFSGLAVRLKLQSPPQLPITWSPARFLRKASTTAACVDHLAHSLNWLEPDLTYLAALFHDIGEAALALADPHLFDDVQGVARITRRTICDVETEVMGWDHAALSAMALRQWNVSPAICDSVQYHHCPESAPAESRQLALILQMADAYFTSKSMACMATPSFSLANLSVTMTCNTYSPGVSPFPSESCPPV